MADFSKVAKSYDFLKALVFGKHLNKACTYFLDRIPANSKILVIGGGTGQILLNFQSTHQITYIELSEVMINQAKKVKSEALIDFIQLDVLKWRSNERYDFVITPFVLDCFTEKSLNSIFGNLNSVLRSEGHWIQTDFYPKNKAQNVMIKIMYSFFRMSTGLETEKLADFDRLFKKYKFICVGKAYFYHSMVESKIYQQIE